MSTAAVFDRPTVAKRPQHMQALAEANRIRLERARVKRDIKSGRRDPATVLTMPELVNMTVAELMCSIQRVGMARARKVLRKMNISENRTIERLTDRQRWEFAIALRKLYCASV